MQAAEAIITVANARMAGAIRLVSIERGFDPKLFAFMPFGGGDGGCPRYYYDALPAFLLLTGRGLLISIEYLNRAPWPRVGQKLKLGWLPVGLVILFIGYNFIWNLPPRLAAQKGKYGITPRPLQIVEQASLAEPALVIVKNVERWNDFAAPFVANSPTLDGPVVYAIDWGPALNQRVRAQFRARPCWELEGNILSRCEPYDLGD